MEWLDEHAELLLFSLRGKYRQRPGSWFSGCNSKDLMKNRFDLTSAALSVTFAAVLVAFAPAVGVAQPDRRIVLLSPTPSATPTFTLAMTPEPNSTQLLLSAIHYCLIVLLLIVPVALGIWWFLSVFTTNLSPIKDDPSTQRAIRNMVYFSYCFILISIGISLLPLIVFLLPAQWTNTAYAGMVESPIAIGLGCVTDDKENKDQKWELACQPDPEPDEWLINIGGDVMSLLKTPCADLSAPNDEAVGLTHCFPRLRVHGGISVPFYFIFVSLMGAAVSMTRRIPEYQRKALEDNEFTPAMAREKIVTQIVQFISAPLIAITVYMLLMPESPTTSIAVAFASGFSSDIVVKAISYVADQFETRSNQAK